MSTTKPRMTITLEKRHHALLVLVAKQQRKSVSALLGELVEAVEPSYRRLTVLVQQASQGQAEILAGLGASVERASDVIAEVLGEHVAQHDLFERARLRVEEKELKVHAGQQLERDRAELRRIAPSPRGAGISPGGKRAPGAASDLVSGRLHSAGVPRSGTSAGRRSDPRPVITGVRSRKGNANTRRGSGRNPT